MTEPDPLAELNRKLDDLGDRVRRIERHVGIVARRAPLPAVAELSPPEPERTQPPPPQPIVPLAASEPPRPRPIASPPAPDPNEGWRLERIIGGKLYGAIGAIIVVIGLVLFLKLAVQRGWLLVSPTYRCLGVGIFGAILLGLGEWVRRRLDTWASAGLTAAGLGAMYAAALAAYWWYAILPQSVTFILLAIVSGIGILASAAARSAFVAALSMVGAYLVPIVLAGKSSQPLVVPVYTSLLLAAGLILAAWRPQPFRVLRHVAFWGTLIEGSLWIFTDSAPHVLLVLGFLAVVWLLMHAELIIGSRRMSETVFAQTEHRDHRRAVTAPMLFSFATTLWCVGVGIFIAHTDAGRTVADWQVAAALAAATMVAATLLAGGLRTLMDPPTTDHERLGVALWAQAGALLITAIALGASSGTWMVGAWLAMALAAFAAARWAKASLLDRYGVVLLLVAAGRLLFWESWTAPAPVATPIGLGVSRWTALMLAGATAWLISAALVGVGRGLVSERRRYVTDAMIAVGVSLAYASAVSSATKAPWFVLTATAAALVLLEVAHRRRSIGLALYAVFAALASAVLWADLYVFNQDSTASGVFKVLTPEGCAVALIAAVAMIVVAWLQRKVRKTGAELSVWPACLGTLLVTAGALVFAATSLWVARTSATWTSDKTAQAAAVSIWWGIFGVGLLVIGFAARSPLTRHIGLGILGLGVLKAVLLDLGEVAPEWRVASFIGLGLLMLIVAVAYAKVSAKLAQATTNQP